jgi:hypothetical protein
MYVRLQQRKENDKSLRNASSKHVAALYDQQYIAVLDSKIKLICKTTEIAIPQQF